MHYSISLSSTNGYIMQSLVAFRLRVLSRRPIFLFRSLRIPIYSIHLGIFIFLPIGLLFCLLLLSFLLLITNTCVLLLLLLSVLDLILNKIVKCGNGSNQTG